MNKKIVWAPLAIALAVSIVACGKKEEKAADGSQIIKIGHVAPLTGGIAHLGKDNENGARLAVEEVNQAGLTINGKKVTLVLVPEDDAADPKTATSVAQKLVDAKVVAVVGHLNSGTTIPASKIYSDAGIVQVSPSATNPDYTKQGFKTTFRLVATDAQQGPALANYTTKNLKAKTVAIIDDATQYGKGLADEFEKTIKAAGVKVLAREATNDKATDFKAILTKIKGLKPDVIMYGGMDATGGPLAKQAKELGIKSKIVAGDGVCTDKVAELAGDAVSNIICSEAGMALAKMEAGEDFQKRYKTRFNADVQIYAPFTYDSVMVIVDAMKRANSTESAKILEAVAQTNMKGLIGNIAFDAKGDLKEGVITLYEYKNKKKSVLEIVKM
ncbi:MAG: branched-chain amino acid ABC transporter substrate-binding protein [Burkholderiaceae bacterium]|jgi:branched-chain amino acid transport system substrate-binding protein|uniref:branched-chain amino acid ABC transporter substrate-binding protein n=1 Tax=Polynucleobacter sp. MWH-Loch1C5 TaxID=2689108 RepID=UPI001C0B9385|nr:branched-chain amino acid ABC transporter substrate-binding protein [Polynucleobacter sp. MWH-Loch1C5]MBU3542786.1 branched-chain amino acid ABC transporter substrate-binding protein [Polynucleobacter sp. MWH-Loch1C5]NBV01318.1 branched-chain amino acid ABC transporter substrate-binding protein [Burkholderiaceae bacterium]